MVEFKDAYESANKIFLENEYAGVHEARENDDSWLFAGKCKQKSYGTFEICIPKNGDSPYIFNVAHEDGATVWKNARIVSI